MILVRNISLIFILFATTCVFAQDIPPQVRDFIRTSPVKAKGSIKFKKDFILRKTHTETFLGNVPVNIWIKKNKKISYNYNFHQFFLESKGGIQISINGIKVDVLKLSYNKKTRKFSTVTDIAFGWRSRDVEKEVNTQLKAEFASKMNIAFSKLVRVLRSSNLTVGTERILAVLDVFEDSTSDFTLPSYETSNSLVVVPKRAKTLEIEKGIYAKVDRYQTLTFTVRHRWAANKLYITGILFKPAGRLVISKTRKDGLLELYLKGFSLTERNGVQLAYTNSVDVLATSISVIFGLALNNASGSYRYRGSSVTFGQDFLDAYMRGNLRGFVKSNKSTMRQAGFSSRLIRAMENDFSDAIDWTEFFD